MPQMVLVAVVLLVASLVRPIGAEARTITVDGGSFEQQLHLKEAIDAFDEAGLELPDVQVRFSKDEADCHGHLGNFEPGQTPWRISVCSDLEFVASHELAHAWERARATDEDRAEFMRVRGHDNWNDSTAGWSDRGAEDAAFVIQQGLMSWPLPARLSDEMVSRLDAFEILTGVPSPRVPSSADV